MTSDAISLAPFRASLAARPAVHAYDFRNVRVSRDAFLSRTYRAVAVATRAARALPYVTCMRSAAATGPLALSPLSSRLCRSITNHIERKSETIAYAGHGRRRALTSHCLHAPHCTLFLLILPAHTARTSCTHTIGPDIFWFSYYACGLHHCLRLLLYRAALLCGACA